MQHPRHCAFFESGSTAILRNRGMAAFSTLIAFSFDFFVAVFRIPVAHQQKVFVRKRWQYKALTFLFLGSFARDLYVVSGARIFCYMLAVSCQKIKKIKK